VFGAADQYLGSRSALGWAPAVSGLSAPWLLLPFIAGMTQRDARRAIVLGLVMTLSALVGYIAMTYSPVENVPIGRFLPGVIAMTTSGDNPIWVVAGLVTGPLFGFFGQRWRVRRSWVSAALVTVALTMEPLARRQAGMLEPHPIVWAAEVAFGVAIAAACAISIANWRKAATRSDP
jgi:uncharacterized protein DUF6518